MSAALTKTDAAALQRLRLVAQVAKPEPLKPDLLPSIRSLLDTESAHELCHALAALASARLAGAQVYVFRTNTLARPILAAASGVGQIDPTSPLVCDLERVLRKGGTMDPAHFHCELRFNGRIHGALYATTLTVPDRRTTDDLLLLARVAASHWQAITRHPRRIAMPRSVRWIAGTVILGAMALALVPVPMSALAPARVVPKAPFVVAAPLDGVIDDILINPNARLEAGTPLLRMVDLPLLAKVELTERELAVAETKLRRTSMLALGNTDAKRELAIAEAEVGLRRVERNHAQELLSRSRVVAPRAGVALFGDRRDWTGKPVATGEKIMEIGDPSAVEFQFELPVDDAIAMAVGQRASVFLDTDPLHPFAAEVTRINHEPRQIEGRGLAFVIHARLPEGTTPALGVRGTAHIRGDTVPLALFLFRRPISFLRQWAGL